MLVDFTLKNGKIGKGNLYLTEKRFSVDEMWCAVVNHNYVVYASHIGKENDF